ncbi:MAG: GAF domain-containing sensor histidine kinase, partial [Anaerolineae bacterium]
KGAGGGGEGDQGVGGGREEGMAEELDMHQMEIPEDVVQRWQDAVDLLARLIGVPAALIMRAEPPYIEVFRASHSEGNPYHVGDRERLAGLYCERVITSKGKLLVPDARKDPAWSQNPDIKLGMVSYLGYPLRWPNGEVFGTICVLDTKENPYTPEQDGLLRQFRDQVEGHLSLIYQAHQLQQMLREKEGAEAQAREARKFLHQEEARLRSLFQAAPVGIGIVSYPDRVLLSVNERLCTMLGYAREELEGQSARLLYESDEEYQRVGREKYAEIRERGVGSVETHFRCKDGHGIDVLLSSAPLDPQDFSQGITFTVLDITHLKQAERVLRQYTEELEQRVRERTAQLEERVAEAARLNRALTNLLEDLQAANRKLASTTRQLEAANQELEAFAYSVSHDLRAPLRAMEGFAQALLEDYAADLDPTARDYARRIVAAAEKMNLLINDLLAYSRLGRQEMRLSSVPLDRVVETVLEELAPTVQEREAQVVVERPLPEVEGHETTLVQVLANLVDNALKFVAPGVRPQVRIWAEARDEAVRLWVEDNGIGIAPEHQGRIFHIFERLHGWEAYPGTGVGLAIVRRGVERMGGHVGVESEIGKGSRFWVELRKGGEGRTGSVAL